MSQHKQLSFFLLLPQQQRQSKETSTEGSVKHRPITTTCRAPLPPILCILESLLCTSLICLKPCPACSWGAAHLCPGGGDAAGAPVQPDSQQDRRSRLTRQPLLGQSSGLKTTLASWERVLRPLKRGWVSCFSYPRYSPRPPAPTTHSSFCSIS